MIPAFRASVASPSITHAPSSTSGRSPPTSRPWMGDEVSGEVAAHYTVRAVDGPSPPTGSLVAYRDELTRVHDTLQQMEDDYRRTEGDNAARWGARPGLAARPSGRSIGRDRILRLFIPSHVPPDAPKPIVRHPAVPARHSPARSTRDLH